MKLYNKDFTLNENAIDMVGAEYVPCEGTIIPIKIDCIEGLRDQLPKYGFGVEYGFHQKKRKIDMVYLFVDDESEKAILCIKYTCDRVEDTQCIHSPRFELEAQEMERLCMVH